MSNAPIFITGRFRSGTSFLWQLFNRLEGFCAWYEPLHPQLLGCIQYVEPKSDHVGIDDYWDNYRQHPGFVSNYRAEFAVKGLYLEADESYPALEQYINKLIELSGDEVPVLQFNRVDLRLSWLKAKFPTATIIHIKRNPLQLYYSQRKHIPTTQKDCNGYWDAYELSAWCHALSELLPVFSKQAHQHAFYDFYLLYQLSELMARNHADVSINLDQDIFQSDEFIKLLTSVVPLSLAQKSLIKQSTHVPELPEFDQKLSDELASLMTQVDLKLMESGLFESFGKQKLVQIKSQHQPFWTKATKDGGQSNLSLLITIGELQTEMTRILAENRQLKQQVDELKMWVNQGKSTERSGSNE